MIVKFIAYYKPYKKVLFTDLLCAALASASVLAYPLLVNRITSAAVKGGGMSAGPLLQTVAMFLFLMVTEYVCTFYTDYCGHAMGAGIEADMRSDLFQHVQKLSFRYYDNTTTGQLMSRMTTDLFDISELAHHGPEDLVISLVRIAGAFVILLSLNGMLTATVFVILLLMALFAYRYSIKLKHALKRSRERVADINSQIEDSLAGIRVVQSFAGERIELDKFSIRNERFLESRKRGYMVEALFSNGMTAFISLINVAVVLVGAMLVGSGSLHVTELITFLLLIVIVVDPVKRLVNFTQNLQNGAAGFERFLELMAIEPDIVDAADAAALHDVQGKVEFADVGFRYAGESDADADSNEVLSHIRLMVQPGEKVALVGASGVGKTTMCSLIPRFYEASEGAVKIDGVDIRNVQLKSLRSHIGIVQQDVYLFAGTIRDNILYGKPDAADDEVEEAAKLANAHEFIMGLPGGYDAEVGQRGVKLSGGQKQRIGIARVFLKNPSILILDEATSALDNESERLVQISFDRLSRGRTTLIIAHRLSTIQHADKIVVLAERRIAEAGTHAELLALNGLYARLYKLQLNGLA